ncbi:MAG: hypothetical protein LBL87_05650 [Ruminococcus sp.]|jgi:hypothetical protein|nr:hypothetical protein [Ruminococcus sp.]
MKNCKSKKLFSAFLAMAMAVSVFAVPVSAEWLEEEDGKTYWIVDDETSKGFEKIEDSWYYFRSADGSMAKGWLKISGNWYYFSKTSGKMLAGKSYKIDGGVYTFGADGKVTAYSSDGYGDYLYGGDYAQIEKEEGSNWEPVIDDFVSIGFLATPTWAKYNKDTAVGKTIFYTGVDGKIFGGGYLCIGSTDIKDGKPATKYPVDDLTEKQLEELYKSAQKEAEKRCGAPFKTTDEGGDKESFYQSGDIIILIVKSSDSLIYMECAADILSEYGDVSMDTIIKNMTD